MGLSNYLVGILNFITFVLSIPIIAAGIWLAKQHDSDCYGFLQKPVIVLGVFILLLSLAGFFGACYKIRWLLWIYLLVMFLLILLLFCFTVFAFVVTNKAAGEAVSGKGYKEYRLGDYTHWLQNQINKASNWDKVKSCIEESKICSKLNDEYITEADFDKADLSPVESGCCKPPTVCGCTFVNATTWSSCSSNGTITDCTIYDSDSSKLCYDCDTCKAGVLQNVNKDWRKVAIINIVIFVFLVIVYSVGCCAFRSSKREKAYRNYP